MGNNYNAILHRIELLVIDVSSANKSLNQEQKDELVQFIAAAVDDYENACVVVCGAYLGEVVNGGGN